MVIMKKSIDINNIDDLKQKMKDAMKAVLKETVKNNNNKIDYDVLYKTFIYLSKDSINELCSELISSGDIIIEKDNVDEVEHR